MPTELRAALRDAAAMLDSYSEIGFYSDAAKARAKVAEFRALADAPPTVAELLPMVDARHEVHAARGDVAIRFRLYRTARVPMPPVDTVMVERHHQGLWWPTRMLPADLTAPARLVEVTP